MRNTGTACDANFKLGIFSVKLMSNHISVLDGKLRTERIERGQDRLTAVEVGLKHVQEDVTEIKEGQKENTKAVISINEAVQKLTMIAEQNQSYEPRIKALEDWKRSIMLKLAGISGALTAGWYFIGEKVTQIISG